MCITSIPRFARLIISAHVLMTRPWESTTDWLKLRPLRLNAIVERPREVNQIPTTGQAARKNVENESYYLFHQRLRCFNLLGYVRFKTRLAFLFF